MAYVANGVLPNPSAILLADEALAIKSDVEGHRGQIALGRSSTVRRTKRKSLKTRSKKQGGGDEGIVHLERC